MEHDSGYPAQGAIAQHDGSVVWHLWAPLVEKAWLVTWQREERKEFPLSPQDRGYFTLQQSHVPEGFRYAYKLADGEEYPDPASRWQPDGVHRPSAVFFAEKHRWSDQSWRGVSPQDLVIYELHVGTFTPEGTFAAIIPRLPDLVSLGVTALELMPIAQFPGERNWGYDGVYPYAAQNTYGGPHGLQRLVDAAHWAGLAVLLDVVYNHFGPEGCYCGKFAPYFTDRYRTPWGSALNFDGAYSDAVRQFVIDNARMWIRDFHVDGLRIDAVHTIYDFGARHILSEIEEAVQQEGARQQRTVLAIAESNLNDVRLVLPPERGGYGLDGVWSDDFHHSVHTILTGERDGYYVDFGRRRQLVKALSDVFVYDGGFSCFRRRRHGNRVGDVERTRFVQCVQNHDQVGNRALGDRFGTLLPPAAQRLACGLLLLSPCVPLLFMGEEYGETRPFPFFCSFADPRLVEAIRGGRRREFAELRFEWDAEIPDAQSPQTFAAAKLTWRWPEGSIHGQMRQLYQDLFALRRRAAALRDRRHTGARLLGDPASQDQHGDPAILLLERGSGAARLCAVANLAGRETRLPTLACGDLPLLLSSEETRYGGTRPAQQWSSPLFPYELLIFGKSEENHG